MDPLFIACSLFRRRKFEQCVELCNQILEKNPYDQAAWSLKTRGLSEQVYIDEVEVDEEGIAEILMDENTIAQVARPGTSLQKPTTGQGAPSQGVRPISQSGRPLSGFLRPGTQSTRPGTMEQAIQTPRTAHTARPVTSASGRYVRLGTASMLSSGDGQFINLARLNIAKYAGRQNLSKALFEYIFHHENDVRNALDLAAQATEACQFKDWWWKVQLGKCYYRLGMYRESEKQFKSALAQQEMVDTYLYLCKVYIRLDQPNAAIAAYKQGLLKFPADTSLLTGIARIYEDLDRRVQQIVNANRVSPINRVSPVNQHFVPAQLHEETSRMTYKPRVQILKRTGQHAAGDTAAANANRVQQSSNRHVKTLEEREAAYAEARLRIMGSASDSETPPPAAIEKPKPLSDQLNCLNLGTNILRQPHGPDDSKGFHARNAKPS